MTMLVLRETEDENRLRCKCGGEQWLINLEGEGRADGSSVNSAECVACHRIYSVHVEGDNPDNIIGDDGAWLMVPPEATEEWVHALANWRQGQRSTPCCEPPGGFELDRARADIAAVLSNAPKPTTVEASGMVDRAACSACGGNGRENDNHTDCQPCLKCSGTGLGMEQQWPDCLDPNAAHNRRRPNAASSPSSEQGRG